MRKLVFALKVLSIVALLSATVHAGEVIVPKGVDFENTPVYYLSLGTSLAAGVQADPPTGKNVVTNVSYPGLLAEIMRENNSKLRHENLGCPGETSDTFIDGGRCDYPHGSQLDEALNFLHAHGKFTGLITIDLGANDVLQCTQGTIDFQCAEEAIERLVYWMRSEHPKASPTATAALLDRGWGRPAQTIDFPSNVLASLHETVVAARASRDLSGQ